MSDEKDDHPAYNHRPAQIGAHPINNPAQSATSGANGQPRGNSAQPNNNRGQTAWTGPSGVRGAKASMDTLNRYYSNPQSEEFRNENGNSLRWAFRSPRGRASRLRRQAEWLRRKAQQNSEARTPRRIYVRPFLPAGSWAHDNLPEMHAELSPHPVAPAVYPDEDSANAQLRVRDAFGPARSSQYDSSKVPANNQGPSQQPVGHSFPARPSFSTANNFRPNAINYHIRYHGLRSASAHSHALAVQRRPPPPTRQERVLELRMMELHRVSTAFLDNITERRHLTAAVQEIAALFANE